MKTPPILVICLLLLLSACGKISSADSVAKSGKADPMSSHGAMRDFASTITPSDVLIYTTSTCPYCEQAKGWLRQNGFGFVECNMTTDPSCEAFFKKNNADGTPYLVVKGHHMRNGFDSDEFLSALQR